MRRSRGGPLDGQRVDLTGGWMDAGDTLKFTQTTSYTVVALLLAGRLDPADAVPLRASAEVGVRWLLKAHPAPDVFVVAGRRDQFRPRPRSRIGLRPSR